MQARPVRRLAAHAVDPQLDEKASSKQHDGKGRGKGDAEGPVAAVEQRLKPRSKAAQERLSAEAIPREEEAVAVVDPTGNAVEIERVLAQDPDGKGTAAAAAGSDAAVVRQQLDPLSPAERSRLVNEQVREEEEVKGVPVVKVVEYQSPKRHRRRPGNAVVLAFRNFGVECKGIVRDILERIAKPDKSLTPQAFGFTLSNEEILKFDKAHPSPGREKIPGIIQVAYDVLLFFVDRVYEGKAIERFWFLETVARMPYFSYSTCLHLYESLGWWRTGGLRVIHFAEEWNELHHLLIMEALGGDRKWADRALGQHAAVFYYWALTLAYLVSPKWSYKFSEMLETHAVSTYRQFIIENEEKLKALPAPNVARRYYLADDPYLFNMDSALARGPTREEPRTPPCETLYDVFVNILEDEWEHVKTMVMCQDYDLMETLKVTQTTFDEVDSRRELWNKWAKDINTMDEMIKLRKM